MAESEGSEPIWMWRFDAQVSEGRQSQPRTRPDGWATWQADGQWSKCTSDNQVHIWVGWVVCERRCDRVLLDTTRLRGQHAGFIVGRRADQRGGSGSIKIEIDQTGG